MKKKRIHPKIKKTTDHREKDSNKWRSLQRVTTTDIEKRSLKEQMKSLRGSQEGEIFWRRRCSVDDHKRPLTPSVGSVPSPRRAKRSSTSRPGCGAALRNSRDAISRRICWCGNRTRLRIRISSLYRGGSLRAREMWGCPRIGTGLVMLGSMRLFMLGDGVGDWSFLVLGFMSWLNQANLPVGLDDRAEFHANTDPTAPRHVFVSYIEKSGKQQTISQMVSKPSPIDTDRTSRIFTTYFSTEA